MIQSGEDFGFALKPRQAFRIGRHGLRQDFDRDLTFQTGIAGPVDFAHSARAERVDDFIRAEAGTWGQGHTAVDYTGGPQRSQPLNQR